MTTVKLKILELLQFLFFVFLLLDYLQVSAREMMSRYLQILPFAFCECERTNFSSSFSQRKPMIFFCNIYFRRCLIHHQVDWLRWVGGVRLVLVSSHVT